MELRLATAGEDRRVRGFVLPLLGYGLATVAGLVLLHLLAGTDYVGPDNDDAMRLVEVRNLLGGQGWFDMTEYRLGLAGGTLMHWSRFIDLPVAALISLFGLILAPERAEAAALAVWPLMLAVATLAAIGLAGLRLGGREAMHIAFGLACLFLVTGNRFLPGAIDHHNAQLMLMAVICAMLIDGRHRASSFAIAGFAGALALAIGAETTPIVAVAALAVACLWAFHGSRVASAAGAFALTLTLAVTLAFFATVPAARWSVVTCDNLSFGYYGVTAVGGALLFLATVFASRSGRLARILLLGPIGAVVLATAWLLAPQCLGDPLGNLDPLLKAVWLDQVAEARSFLAVLRTENSLFGGYYAVGLLAVVVCLARIRMGDRSAAHGVLAALVAVSLAVALVQVRGAVFSNLLAIVPLSALIVELRALSRREPENIGAAFFFLVTVLMSVPSVWALGGVLAIDGSYGLEARLLPRLAAAKGGSAVSCYDRAALGQLASLPKGTVAAPIDLGAPILRFTQHRVLAGPYHRNQGGMLAEMHIGLAVPSEAAAFLRGAGVDWLAHCESDGETRELARMKPDGLYAALARGQVPAYLTLLPRAQGSPVTIYRVDRSAM